MFQELDIPYEVHAIYRCSERLRPTCGAILVRDPSTYNVNLRFHCPNCRGTLKGIGRPIRTLTEELIGWKGADRIYITDLKNTEFGFISIGDISITPDTSVFCINRGHSCFKSITATYGTYGRNVALAVISRPRTPWNINFSLSTQGKTTRNYYESLMERSCILLNEAPLPLIFKEQIKKNQKKY